MQLQQTDRYKSDVLILQEAALTGCQTLDLNVLEWNPARKFYEAHGGIDITESESWHFYRWTKPAVDKLIQNSEDV